MSTAVSNRLNSQERSQFRKCEETIRNGLDTFFSVGTALKEIRDLKLYREAHGTFEKYCDDVWDMGRSRAYQLIDVAEVQADLSTNGGQTKMVDIKNERQIREIAIAPPESRKAVVTRAAEIAQESGNASPTAKQIKQAREEIAPKPSTNGKNGKPPVSVPDTATQPRETDGKRLLSRQKLINTLRACYRALDEYHSEVPNKRVHGEIMRLLQDSTKLVWKAKK